MTEDNNDVADRVRLDRSDDMQPVEGTVELDVPAGALWSVFDMPQAWPRWNPCFAWVRSRQLDLDALLVWAFEPVRPAYLYRMPAIARIVELEARRTVNWEVAAFPGTYARHIYRIKALGEGRSRFGSWEKATRPGFQALGALWLARFRFDCDTSLTGARELEQRYLREGSFQPLLSEFGQPS